MYLLSQLVDKKYDEAYFNSNRVIKQNPSLTVG